VQGVAESERKISFCFRYYLEWARLTSGQKYAKIMNLKTINIGAGDDP
jgi:hypothetical protein